MLPYLDLAPAAYVSEAPESARRRTRSGTKLTVEEAYRELLVRGLLGSVALPPGTATNTNYQLRRNPKGQSPGVIGAIDSDIDVAELRRTSLSDTPAIRYLTSTTSRSCHFVTRQAVGDVTCSIAGSLQSDSTAPTELLEFLRALPDNWDGEEAPRPSAEAIRRAESLLSHPTMNGAQVTDVDADVLGGVAIWLAGPSPTASAWVSLMNNGTDTLVLSENGKVTHRPWDQLGHQALEAFLRGTGDAARG